MSENQQNPNPISGAITFPARSVENVQPVPVQPRQPTNLQGLLRFAMEATKAEDAPGNSQMAPMDEERRKFLEEALKSLTVDMAEVIRKAIGVLSDAERMKSIRLEDDLPEDVQQAFDNLLELVDDIDVANDFHKMGGFTIFPVCFSCENERVRALACTVLGDICQNNPYCQQRVLETGLLNVLMGLVAAERGEALVKCVYALSCACREYEPACASLVGGGGCAALAGLLGAGERAARTKAAFLVRYLCHNHDAAREKFIELNIIKTIAEQIKQGRDDTTEHLISIILSMAESLDPAVMSQCKDKNLQLRSILENHLKHEDLKTDQFREEKEYCSELIKLLDNAPNKETVDYEVDR